MKAQRLLSPGEMKAILKERAAKVEAFLSGALPAGTPPRLANAMLYSLQAGGKRLRPVLCLTCALLCGGEEASVLPFACAIEMIHTYSLIHDDLPAMDDDDMRRGRPSCHKAFDEATAILAGDGLLTEAFNLAGKTAADPGQVLAAIRELAAAAGPAGMVGGQMLDMEYTGVRNITFEKIRHMQSLKTGAMLRASCVCGAILAGASASQIRSLGAYGRYLGSAFQVVDDILDITGDSAVLGKPAGSDESQGKNTCPSVIGLERSRELAREDAARAEEALASFSGIEAAFLLSLLDYTLNRCS